MIVRVESTLEAAQRYVARCRLAGDARPTEALLREICHRGLAARVAADLLRQSWRA